MSISLTIVETWRIIDRWWTDTPIRREYADVIWNGKHLVFVKEEHDPVWRILRQP